MEDLEINFKGTENHHKCQTIRDGDWIVFTCSLCPGYIKRLNWRTREVISKGCNEFNHTGSYCTKEYREAFENVN